MEKLENLVVNVFFLLFLQGQAAYDWAGWFFRMQMFSYLGMAFQLLRIDSTVKFWHSIGYVGHAILPVLYAVGVLLVKPITKSWPERSDGEVHLKKAQ